MSSYNKRVFKSCIQNFFKAIAKTLAGIKSFLNVFKDTHRGKAPSSKSPAPKKCMNMYIWVFCTSNQLFRRGSYSVTKFSKR